MIFAESIPEIRARFLRDVVSEFGLRRFPRADELESPTFSASNWLAQQGVPEPQLYARLCRKNRLPYLPSFAVPDAPSVDLISLLSPVLPLGARTAQPWLMIDVVGHRPVMAHYDPSSPDNQGVPLGSCFRVLITPRDYDKVIASSPPRAASLPQHPVSDAEFSEHASAVAPTHYTLEDGSSVPCADILAQIDNQGLAFIPLVKFPVLTEAQLEGIGEIVDQKARDHEALCYSVLKNHYFALAATNVNGPLQDILRQLDDSEAIERRWVTTAWAPSGFILSRRGNRGGNGPASLFEASLQAGELLINPGSFDGFRAESNTVDPGALLQWIFFKATQDKASDLHIEGDAGQTRVRMRIDGDLCDLVRLPTALLPVLTNLIKTACRLPLGTRHKILDGRFTIRHAQKNSAMECRVSIIPQPEFEATVIRFSHRSVTQFSADALHFEEHHHRLLSAAMGMGRGMIAITGPTGSGKSTTLYTMLSEARSGKSNIVTIENPIEVQLDGIRQFATADDQGFTFNEIFKGVLRQDPDKIMVGEMRDRDSAEIAVRAALTGHLLITTLHTNDALGVIPRMISMGIDPAQLADALLLLQAQRLVAKLCPDCSEEYTITSREADLLRAEKIPVSPDLRVRRQSVSGCEKCRHRGTHGQQVIMEVFPVNRALSEMIRNEAPYGDMLAYVQSRGWRTLYQHALSLFVRQVISIEEARNHVADFDPFSE